MLTISPLQLATPATTIFYDFIMIPFIDYLGLSGDFTPLNCDVPNADDMCVTFAAII
jgi:hypothetical protein